MSLRSRSICSVTVKCEQVPGPPGESQSHSGRARAAWGKPGSLRESQGHSGRTRATWGELGTLGRGQDHLRGSQSHLGEARATHRKPGPFRGSQSHSGGARAASRIDGRVGPPGPGRPHMASIPWISGFSNQRWPCNPPSSARHPQLLASGVSNDAIVCWLRPRGLGSLSPPGSCHGPNSFPWPRSNQKHWRLQTTS